MIPRKRYVYSHKYFFSNKQWNIYLLIFRYVCITGRILSEIIACLDMTNFGNFHLYILGMSIILSSHTYLNRNQYKSQQTYRMICSQVSFFSCLLLTYVRLLLVSYKMVIIENVNRINLSVEKIHFLNFHISTYVNSCISRLLLKKFLDSQRKLQHFDVLTEDIS